MTEQHRKARVLGMESEIEGLLLTWRAGDRRALDRLMPLVYDELHRLAEGYLRRERPAHTLQATAVIHEAYLRLLEGRHPDWEGRLHFFAVAARLMRRILVDHARGRRAAKRGGEALRMPLNDVIVGGGELPLVDLLSVDAALAELARRDPRKVRVLELRYFGGLTARETAEVLEVSVETVHLDSRFARAWLLKRLGAPENR